MTVSGAASGTSGDDKRATCGHTHDTTNGGRITGLHPDGPAGPSVADAMQPLAPSEGGLSLALTTPVESAVESNCWPSSVQLEVREPQAVFTTESLEAALRQLALYGPDGLSVVTTDGTRIVGWVTSDDVLRPLTINLVEQERAAPVGVSRLNKLASLQTRILRSRRCHCRASRSLKLPPQL